MKEVLKEKIKELIKERFGEEIQEFKVERPRDEKLGDLASNVAFILARKLKKNPMDLSRELAEELREDPFFSSVEAVRGFLNFRFSDEFLLGELKKILRQREEYYREDIGKGEKVQIEFVSANPTGPLHLGHGRGAVLGDTLSRIMEFFGYDVVREYYINDAGRQVYLLGVSVFFRYLEDFGEERKEVKEIFEKDGYRGEYVKEIASLMKKVVGRLLVEDKIEEAYRRLISSDLPFKKEYLLKYPEDAKRSPEDLCALFGLDMMMDEIRKDLEGMDIEFDVWVSERKIYKEGLVEKVIEMLKERGYVYESQGALWLKTSIFGDDKDRVIVRSDGSYTYFAPDIAYHYYKYKRGFRKVINLWGWDHSGYVPRIKASLQMLGIPEDWLEVYLIQMVKLFKEGKEVKMSKRAGNFVTLRELTDSVGKDAVRFVFLTKRSDTPLDVDVDKIRENTAENPVFYVQYAHARICGVFREVRERFKIDPEEKNLEDFVENLKEKAEKRLIKKIILFKDELKEITVSRDPHLITYLLIDLAGDFHNYYNHYRIMVDDRDLMLARLALLKAIRTSLRLGLKLIGVSAPERM